MKLYLLCFVCSFFLFIGVRSSSLMVNTNFGIVVGKFNVSAKQNLYISFEGIPYAKPPLDDLRFKEPELPDEWQAPLLTLKRQSNCLEYRYLGYYDTSDRVSGSEDCLYLNIYIPMRCNSTNLFPVIIWINGGAFQFGSADEVTEKYAMDYNFILVTFNYRIGPLGFLSTEDNVVQGNMGLKDQNAAIRWVKENIGYFKGDADNINIIGEGAGGASVHLHYFSPLSSGLFNGGLSATANALDRMYITKNPLKKARKLASIFSCPDSSNAEMVECLRKVPAKDLTDAIGQFLVWGYNPSVPFGPVVEKGGSLRFISELPSTLLQKGKVQDVPWITGVPLNAGLWTSAYFIQNETILNDLNTNWNRIAPYLLNFNEDIPESEQDAVSQKIRKEYFGSEPINKKTRDNVTLVMSDRLHFSGAYEAAKLMAAQNKSPVGFYLHHYRANHSWTEVLTGTKEDLGICVGDDVILFIYYDERLIPTSEKDLEMQAELLGFWDIFANQKEFLLSDKTWSPVNPEGSELSYRATYGPKSSIVESSSNFGNKDFWNSIGLSNLEYKV